MLIIPFERAIDWRRPPVVTFFLVLINVFVWFAWQAGEDETRSKAVEFYFASNLPSIEFPAYLKQLEATRDPELPAVRDLFQRRDAGIFIVMKRDSDFMAQLRANRIITPGDPSFESWRATRSEFDARFPDGVSERYAFVPEEHRPVTFLTHMFLHGSTSHLLGNMVFLVLVGLAVELALGSVIYLGFYLLGGLGAVALFYLANASSSIPLVGASGAISAVMALYAVVFGKRKIRFFYSMLFYFDYIKAPAYLMLFLWLGNEFFQLFFGGESNVAYLAHIGGLISGAFLGLSTKLMPQKVNLDYLNANETNERRKREFERGLKLMSDLQVEKAVAVFRTMHEESPEDAEILDQLYKAARMQPGSETHHHAARRLLEGLPAAEGHELFQDYLATTQGKVKLPSTRLLVLARKFAKADFAETAERILVVLARRQPSLPGLADGFRALGEAWRRRGDEKRLLACQQQARSFDAPKIN